MTDDTIIGSHGDYDPRDLSFIRNMREGKFPDVELVQSQPPIEPWSRTIGHAFAYGAFILIMVAAAKIMFWVFAFSLGQTP